MMIANLKDISSLARRMMIAVSVCSTASRQWSYSTSTLYDNFDKRQSVGYMSMVKRSEDGQRNSTLKACSIH